jgi:L-threonylcarbamoyladenylate synthase
MEFHSRGEGDAAAIADAARILRAGGLVAFPTETVYGLGADATNVAALDRLFTVKGRPRTHPLIVHLGDPAWLPSWAVDISSSAARLAEAFWPGPLTLILRRAPGVPDAVTGRQETVGLRVPAHPVAHALLAAFGGGIAAPSANRFGRISPTTAAHVRADLGSDVDFVLDGGPSVVGIESTIVDLSTSVPRVLRPGHITIVALEAVLGESVRTVSDGTAPRAPGTLDAHYAPRLPLELVASANVAERLAVDTDRTALLAFTPPPVTLHLFVQAPTDPAAYAHRLYATLRELDASGASRIVVEAPPAGDPAWEGVLDRLRRAARGDAQTSSPR